MNRIAHRNQTTNGQNSFGVIVSTQNRMPRGMIRLRDVRCDEARIDRIPAERTYCAIGPVSTVSIRDDKPQIEEYSLLELRDL